MSLDVWLTGPEKDVVCTCSDCGNEHATKQKETFYSANITHNLGKMAEEAGIYKHLWRPEEICIGKAAQLIVPLKRAIKKMKADPERFKKLNSPNGWGLYENFVPWIEAYCAACVSNPGADVNVSR